MIPARPPAWQAVFGAGALDVEVVDGDDPDADSGLVVPEWDGDEEHTRFDVVLCAAEGGIDDVGALVRGGFLGGGVEDLEDTEDALLDDVLDVGFVMPVFAPYGFADVRQVVCEQLLVGW